MTIKYAITDINLFNQDWRIRPRCQSEITLNVYVRYLQIPGQYTTDYEPLS